MAGGLVVVLIPIGIIPLRRLVFGARIQRFGRLVACHCLSVPALIVKQVAVGILRVDAVRALLSRHRRQSSIETIIHPAPKAFSTEWRRVDVQNPL